jgi:hypothetical protein
MQATSATAAHELTYIPTTEGQGLFFLWRNEDPFHSKIASPEWERLMEGDRAGFIKHGPTLPSLDLDQRTPRVDL